MSVISVLGHRIKAGVLGLALLGLAAAAVAAPSWFGRLNYQGQLTDDQGAPVSDGTYNVDFRIYNNSSGGTPLWTETQSVTVAKGLFNAVLGTINPLNSLVADDDLWIALDVEGNGEMVPRQQLLPAVYAFNARRLDGQPTGTAPYNIVQLDSTGKIPAGLVSGGSVSLPLDMTGNGGAYNLRVNNTGGSGIAISATTASGSLPAIFAEAPRYAGYFKTNNDSTGIALQANSINGYASLVDRPANAQVYGLATIASTLGVLGVNSHPSGTGVAGSGGNIGVSGTGGTYGVYGATSQNSAGARGILGQYTGPAAAEAIRGENTSTATGARGVAGIHTPASGAGIGVYGQSSANTTNAVGVQGVATGTTAQVYGVRGDISGTNVSSAAVYGRATGDGSTAIVADSAAAMGGVGIRASATGTNSTAISANGYRTAINAWASQPGGTGVIGEGQVGVLGRTLESGGAGVEGYSESSLSPAIYGYTGEDGPAILAEAYQVGVSGTAQIHGIYGLASSPIGVGGRFIASDTIGVNAGVWGSTNSGLGYGGRFTNNAGGTGLMAESSSFYGAHIVSTNYVGALIETLTTNPGYWGLYVRANNGNSARGVYVTTAGTSSRSVWAEATGASSYGVQGTATNTSGRGVYGQAANATGYGGYFENTAAVGGQSGAALFVNGSANFGAVTGPISVFGTAITPVSSQVVNNTYVNSTDEIMITPRSDLGGVRYWISSVVNGSFTISFAPSLTTSESFSYFIVGD